jgi:hypothetical protein
MLDSEVSVQALAERLVSAHASRALKSVLIAVKQLLQPALPNS